MYAIYACADSGWCFSDPAFIPVLLHSSFYLGLLMVTLRNKCARCCTVGYLHGCAFHWFVACWSMGWMYFCLGSVILSSYVWLLVLSFTSAFRTDSSNRDTCYPPVWKLRAVTRFPFPFSSLALWPSPCCLVIFLLMVHSLHFFQKILHCFRLLDKLFVCWAARQQQLAPGMCSLLPYGSGIHFAIVHLCFLFQSIPFTYFSLIWYQ